MMTIGYPPTEVGGTEIYVASLAEELARRRHVVEIAYIEPVPLGDDISVCSGFRDGTRVHQIQVPRSRYALETVVFDPDLQSAVIDTVRRLVRQRQPDIIHVHPLQLGLESHVMAALHADGRRVMLTYHSSTTCCARGDLVRFGKTACDGLIRQVECTECLMESRGVPRAAAAVAARVPLSWFKAVHRRAGRGRFRKLRSFSSLPLLIEERQRAWQRSLASTDRLVAVCNWVESQCLANGAPREKLVVSRHGHRFASRPGVVRTAGPVRYGYVGRLSPEKGIEVLLDAMMRCQAGAPFSVEIVSATFDAPHPSSDEQDVIARVRDTAARDSRLVIVGAVADSELTARIGTWDALIVPSLWFESGPQVVYEAFAAQTPVIGSRRGGIAELVTEGETGFLIAPGDAAALSALLARFADHPDELRTLRAHIPPVRTTAAVADDMIRLYEEVAEPHVAAV